MYVYAVESLQNTWFTGVKHTKIKVKKHEKSQEIRNSVGKTNRIPFLFGQNNKFS